MSCKMIGIGPIFILVIITVKKKILHHNGHKTWQFIVYIFFFRLSTVICCNGKKKKKFSLPHTRAFPTPEPILLTPHQNPSFYSFPLLNLPSHFSFFPLLDLPSHVFVAPVIMDKRSVIVPPSLHAPSSQPLPHAITIAAPPSCNHHRCPSIWGIWFVFWDVIALLVCIQDMRVIQFCLVKNTIFFVKFQKINLFVIPLWDGIVFCCESKLMF